VLLRLHFLTFEAFLCRQLHWLLRVSFQLLLLISNVGRIGVNQLSLVVLDKEFECLGTISFALGTGMGSYPNHSYSIQLAEVVILELLGNSPRDQVARRSHPSFQLVSQTFFADFTFEGDLYGAENIWEASIGFHRT